MAFEHLGNDTFLVSTGTNIITLAVSGPRPYTAQLYLDGLATSVILVEIQVDFDPFTPKWRRVWDSGEVTVEPVTVGIAEIPGLAIPPWVYIKNARMVVTLISGPGGNLAWDLFGL